MTVTESKHFLILYLKIKELLGIKKKIEDILKTLTAKCGGFLWAKFIQHRRKEIILENKELKHTTGSELISQPLHTNICILSLEL